MLDVTAYLDDRFPDFETLSRELDRETELAREHIVQIDTTIENERHDMIAENKQATQKLKSYLATLEDEIMHKVPSDRDFNGSIKPLMGVNPAACQDIKSGFKDLQTLTKGLQVVKRIRNIEQGITSSAQKDNSLSVCLGLLDDERGLLVFAGSSNPSVAKLAKRGLKLFNEEIRQPLQMQCKQELRKLLKDSKWPKASPSADTFVPLFVKLLQTEAPFEPTPKPQPLQGFSVLAEQYDIRFKFHFEGDRETNRLDKPEWAFEHFKSTLEEQLGFLDLCVKPALAQSEEFADRSAMTEFITAMLPSVYHMLKRVFPLVLESPKLLSHLVYQTGQFDQMLQQASDEGGFFYKPYGFDNWRGLTGDILAKNQYFDKWLAVERENALTRYREIVESDGSAFDIDFESVDPGETKPTHSAIRLKDLLEGISDHYQQLRSVNYRLRFLLEIQIDLLDKYFDRLQESVNAFDSMSSSLARSIGGVLNANEDQARVSGLTGIERLCRLYGSAEYIRAALETWSQELFFLTLWEDISKLSSKKSLDSKVTDALQELPAHIPQHEDEDGTLFDETIASYDKLKQRVMQAIHSLLKKELHASLHNYLRTSDWKSEHATSAKLSHPIKHLSSLLTFLQRFHATNDYKRICRQFSHNLERCLWNFVIQANSFTIHGGQRLAQEITQIWSGLQLVHDASYRKLQQACLILSSTDMPDKLSLVDLTADDINNVVDRKI